MMKTIAIPAGKLVPDQGAAIPAQIRALLPGSAHLPRTVLAADTLLVPDLLLPAPTRRLIVLVPAGEISEQVLVHRVWQMASSSDLDVLYLALSPDADQVSYQRRRLAGLAAQTTYQHVRAGIGVSAGKNWPQMLRPTLQPGDLLVCLAGDRTPGFFRRQALGERLAADLCMPVYQLGGLHVKPEPPSLYWLKDILAWVAAIIVIAAFFWLQVGIDRAAAKPLSTILLCLSVGAEFYCIWKINNWIG